jgi:hypothetical protein
MPEIKEVTSNRCYAVLYKKLEQCVEGTHADMCSKELQNVKCQEEGAENLKKLFIFAAVWYHILMTV